MSIINKHSPTQASTDSSVGDSVPYPFKESKCGHSAAHHSYTRSRWRVHSFLNQKCASEATPFADNIHFEKNSFSCERPRSMSLSRALVEPSQRQDTDSFTPHALDIKLTREEEQQLDLQERLDHIQNRAELWKERQWAEVHKGCVERQNMESSMRQRLWQSRTAEQDRALRRMGRLMKEMRSKLLQDT